MTKTIIITGASDGIGKATARALCAAGNKVVLVGRSREKTKAIADELGADYYLADFAKLDDVRALATKLAQHYPTIDVLYNNAGLLAPQARTETVDGHELTFQVNHLAPFLLTTLLMDTLVASKTRIINTASRAHKNANLDFDNLDMQSGYKSFTAYANSKLANILFSRELVRRYSDKGIVAVSFHPGIVSTGFAKTSGGVMGFFYNNIVGRFFLSSEQGADTMIWLTTATDIQPGAYYIKRKVTDTTSQAKDKNLAEKLWEISQTLVTKTSST